MIERLSSLTIPAVLLLLCFCFLRNGEMYDSFVRGAREGMSSIVSVLPAMTLLLCAVTVFSESGAADALTRLISPFTERLGIPPGVTALAITRPFSGSASIAAFADLIEKYGADSREAFAAALIMSSGDTLVYVISVYTSPTRARKTGCVVPIAVFTAIFGVFFACLLTNIFFS